MFVLLTAHLRYTAHRPPLYQRLSFPSSQRCERRPLPWTGTVPTTPPQSFGSIAQSWPCLNPIAYKMSQLWLQGTSKRRYMGASELRNVRPNTVEVVEKASFATGNLTHGTNDADGVEPLFKGLGPTHEYIDRWLKPQSKCSQICLSYCLHAHWRRQLGSAWPSGRCSWLP